MPTPTFTIASANKTSVVRLDSLDLSYQMGSRAVLRCETRDMLADSTSAYRPAIDDTCVLDISGTIFSGRVIETTERAAVSPARRRTITVSAVDHSTILAIRLVNDIWTAGVSYTQKEIVQWMVTTYLAADGVTVSGSMASGPSYTEGMRFENVTVESVLNYLQSLSGWPWRMDSAKVINMWSPGSVSASYSLTTSNTLYASVRKTRTKFANRIVVNYGGQQEVTETMTATGAANPVWALTYPAVTNADGLIMSQGYVLEDDGSGFLVKRDVSLYSAGTTLVEWDASVNSLRFNYTPASGVDLSFRHTTDTTLTEVVEDAASIAAIGKYEFRVDLENTFDRDHAISVGTGLLRKMLVVKREAIVRTRAGMAYPGQTITITLPQWVISGDWMITQVRVRDLTKSEFEYELTCLEGDESAPIWMDAYKPVFGHDGQSGTAGVTTPSLHLTPASIFAGDVVANFGLHSNATGYESALTIASDTKGGLGASLRLNRPGDGMSWDLFAAGPTSGDPSVHLVHESDHTSNGPAFRINRDAQGRYVLLPTTHVAGSKGLSLGDFHSLQETASADRRLEAVFAYDIGAVNGFWEQSRTTMLGHQETYTPTWTMDGGSPLTVGNATRSGWFCRIGQFVWFEAMLVVGSTSTVGSGNMFLTVPITAHSDYAGSGRYPKTLPGTTLDSSGPAEFTIEGQFSTATTIFFKYDGTNVSQTVPFTWGTNDRLMVEGFYRAA